MSLPPSLARLTAVAAEADHVVRLDSLLRRSVQEVCMWRREDATTCDGLSMEECRDLVETRAMDLLHVETLAAAVPEVLSVLVPLADRMEEVDDSIRAVAAWLETLYEGSTADDVLAVCAAAHDTGLLKITRAHFQDAEGLASYEAAMEYYLAMSAKAVCDLSLSGRRATLVLDEDGIVLAAQIEGDEWAVVCLIAHQGSGGDDGDDEPEPEPEPDPARPELVDA